MGVFSFVKAGKKILEKQSPLVQQLNLLNQMFLQQDYKKLQEI
jgi:hypothetical protein